METEQPTWLEMEPVLERVEPLLESYMKIIFLAGKGPSGNHLFSSPFKLLFVVCNCTIIHAVFFTTGLCRFSVSNDLKYDAERDLRDIGAKNIQVHSLNKVH